jgi:hypothetical protein
MEQSTLLQWYFDTLHQGLMEFVKPLLPWVAFSFIMVFADWRFTYELWAMNKDRKAEDMPKGKTYLNKIGNSILLILLAGCLRVSTILDIGVEVISTTGLIVWSAIEFTRVFNKYMQIEGMGIKINLFKLFKKTKVDDVIDQTDEAEQKLP